MRGGRSLLVLLAVALGLGAYIYFVESKRDPNAGEPHDRVFSIEASAINHIEVHAASGESTTLDKQGDTWRISQPVTAKADTVAASSIADALSTTEIDTVLQEAPGDLAPFGLSPARLSVTFRTSGDDTPHTLNLGKKTPTGSEIYAQVDGQPRLLLLGGFVEDTLNRTTFDLRDKTVLTFDRAKVDQISIDQAGKPRIDLALESGDWSITAPVTARGDFSPIDGLISRIDAARMSAIALEGSEPTPAQLKTFGLDRPRIVTTFGAGSTRAALALGADKDATSVYARDLSRPVIFVVEKSLLTDLEKDPGDLRVKDVFEFKSYTAVGLEVSHAGTSATFAKQASTVDAAAGPDEWKQTAPAAKSVNLTAMTDLLNTLSSLRAERFVTVTPTSGDDLVVVARFGSAEAPTEERVTLRKNGDTAYAISPREPGAAVIPTADFDKAVTQFKELTAAK